MIWVGLLILGATVWSATAALRSLALLGERVDECGRLTAHLSRQLAAIYEVLARIDGHTLRQAEPLYEQDRRDQEWALDPRNIL